MRAPLSISVLFVVITQLGLSSCRDDRTTTDGGVSVGDGGVLIDGGIVGCFGVQQNIGQRSGFCAQVIASDLGFARHATFSPSGDLYVAIANPRTGLGKGHITALRDVDHNGSWETKLEFYDNGGNGIFWKSGYLYFAENDRVTRFTLPDGQLVPTEDPVIIVSGLPATGDHPAKSIIVDDNNRLWVNIASATNSCQADNRQTGAPGIEPCPELAVRAGVWFFDANTPNQTMANGTRFATGLRNLTAMAIRPEDHQLYGVINGRDQLHDNWPQWFTEEQDQQLPAEEFFAIKENGDYGWPYCFYDPIAQKKVRAPEYGGNGTDEGMCGATEQPLMTLPAHWSPLSMLFYRGDKLPMQYRGGVFIATHGNRFSPNAATPPPGYNVLFVAWGQDGKPAKTFEVFADGFAGSERPLPDEAAHRPVGLAQAPDGALFITDDTGGRVWRVTAEMAGQ